MRTSTNFGLFLFPGQGICRDTVAFISNSGFHRLNFPLWLKSSFRVKAVSCSRCGSARYIFLWLDIHRDKPDSCQPFHCIGFVPNKVAAVQSYLCLQPFIEVLHPKGSKNQNSKKQSTISLWSTSSWCLSLSISVFITDVLIVLKR